MRCLGQIILILKLKYIFVQGGGELPPPIITFLINLTLMDNLRILSNQRCFLKIFRELTTKHSIEKNLFDKFCIALNIDVFHVVFLN